MTKRDIMLQVLSEIFQKPQGHVALLCDRLFDRLRVVDADVPLQENAALRALEEFRESKDEIFTRIVNEKLLTSLHPDKPII